MSRSGDSRLSLWSTHSFLSIGCRGSALSVGSVGSVASIASAGSFGSVLSVGSALSVGSGLSWLSLWSLLSQRSIGGVLASRHRRAATSGLLLAAGLLTVDRRLRGRPVETHMGSPRRSTVRLSATQRRRSVTPGQTGAATRRSIDRAPSGPVGRAGRKSA